MCTSVSFVTKDHYFGRNLDLEFSYHETVAVTPRNKAFAFRHEDATQKHLAMIGMAFVVDDYPLYYDATNEKGLSIAGLNFPGNACYGEPVEGKHNVASFELIPWLLSSCESVAEARLLLENTNITDDSFSPELPPATLHWMIADQKESIVFEQTQSGGKVYDNPVGVMTNNPTFDYQMLHLQDYMTCSPDGPVNKIAAGVDFSPYSRGMGGIGIPGDLSSASRFVKVAFTKMNSLVGELIAGDSLAEGAGVGNASGGAPSVDESSVGASLAGGARVSATESASISQFFKILGSVEQQKGCCRLGVDAAGNPICEYTIYSSCCNIDKGIYYYTTYENSQISAVNMNHEDLDGESVIVYELIKGQQIREQN